MARYVTPRGKYNEDKSMYTHMLTATAKNKLKETASEYKVSASELLETIIRAEEFNSLAAKSTSVIQ